MASLFDELERRRRPSPPCQFGRWLDTASDHDRADLALVFPDRKRYPGALIAEVLSIQVDGWVVDNIRAHRRGACQTCPKTAEYLNTDPSHG